jgi:hypothetical protein
MSQAVNIEEAQKAYKTFIRVLKAELPESPIAEDTTVVVWDTKALDARVAARHKSLAASMQEILDARGLDIAVTETLVTRFELHKARVTTALSNKMLGQPDPKAVHVVIEGFRVALDDLVSNKIPLTLLESRSKEHSDASRL